MICFGEFAIPTDEVRPKVFSSFSSFLYLLLLMGCNSLNEVFVNGELPVHVQKKLTAARQWNRHTRKHRHSHIHRDILTRPNTHEETQQHSRRSEIGLSESPRRLEAAETKKTQDAFFSFFFLLWKRCFSSRFQIRIENERESENEKAKKRERIRTRLYASRVRAKCSSRESRDEVVFPVWNNVQTVTDQIVRPRLRAIELHRRSLMIRFFFPPTKVWPFRWRIEAQIRSDRIGIDLRLETRAEKTHNFYRHVVECPTFKVLYTAHGWFMLY